MRMACTRNPTPDRRLRGGHPAFCTAAAVRVIGALLAPSGVAGTARMCAGRGSIVPVVREYISGPRGARLQVFAVSASDCSRGNLRLSAQVWQWRVRGRKRGRCRLAGLVADRFTQRCHVDEGSKGRSVDHSVGCIRVRDSRTLRKRLGACSSLLRLLQSQRASDEDAKATTLIRLATALSSACIGVGQSLQHCSAFMCPTFATHLIDGRSVAQGININTHLVQVSLDYAMRRFHVSRARAMLQQHLQLLLRSLRDAGLRDGGRSQLHRVGQLAKVAQRDAEAGALFPAWQRSAVMELERAQPYPFSSREYTTGNSSLHHQALWHAAESEHKAQSTSRSSSGLTAGQNSCISTNSSTSASPCTAQACSHTCR